MSSQAEYWNEVAGKQWVEADELLDRQLAPLGALALNAAAVRTGERVLDVGCGCGATTADLASAVGPSGRVTGLDLSAPMLARARERIRDPNVDLVLGDASTHPLPHEAFDLAFSRFGVMFFEEPAAAFAHLRSRLRADGRIAWVVWQRPDVNHWASVPVDAVRGLVEIPAPEPYAPGPFSLADPDHLTRLLATAGYRDVALGGHELELAVGGGLPLADAVEFLLAHGPVFRVLGTAPADVRAAARDRLLDALAPHERPSGVWFAAAVWVVTGHA